MKKVREDKDVPREVIAEYGVCGYRDYKTIGRTELRVNLISWDHKDPVVDIRWWMGDTPLKGFTFGQKYAKKVCQCLKKMVEEDDMTEFAKMFGVEDDE